MIIKCFALLQTLMHIHVVSFYVKYIYFNCYLFTIFTLGLYHREMFVKGAEEMAKIEDPN